MDDTLEKGEYQKILENPITFTAAFKTLKDTGNLVYEYNPFMYKIYIPQMDKKYNTF